MTAGRQGAEEDSGSAKREWAPGFSSAGVGGGGSQRVPRAGKWCQGMRVRGGALTERPRWGARLRVRAEVGNW